MPFNVIVVNLDSLRSDYTGVYAGGRVATPALAGLAERAAVFDRYYLGSYPCLPNRRDTWTGRYEFPFRGWGPLQPDDVTFPALAGAADRVAMFISDNFLLVQDGRGSLGYQSVFSHWDFIRGNGFDPWVSAPFPESVRLPADPGKLMLREYEQYLRNGGWQDRPDDERFVARVMRRSVEWLEANHRQPGFLLWVDCFDPHEPWDPPAGDVALYDSGYRGQAVVQPLYGSSERFTPAELTHMRALYAGKITLADRWLGRLLDAIERLGLYKNTVLMVLTDHGVLLGEHGTVGKPGALNHADGDANLYRELVTVPLLVCHPDLSAGRRVSGIVQPVDLFPTILASLGLPVPANVHGRDLTPAVLGPAGTAGREFAFFGRAGEAFNVADEEWTLFFWPDGDQRRNAAPLREQLRQESLRHHPRRDWFREAPSGRHFPSALYRLTDDPGQTRDRAAAYPEVAARLRRAAWKFADDIGAPHYWREVLE